MGGSALMSLNQPTDADRNLLDAVTATLEDILTDATGTKFTVVTRDGIAVYGVSNDAGGSLSIMVNITP